MMSRTNLRAYLIYILLALMMPVTTLHAQTISNNSKSDPLIITGTSVTGNTQVGGYSTVVYARLFNDDTDITSNADYEVNAFMGGECRAVGTTSDLPDGSKILVFRIWGNIGTSGINEMGQTVTFVVRDRTTGIVYDVTPDEVITFRGDYTYGMPSAPVALRINLDSGPFIKELQAAKDHIFVYKSESDIRERLDALITKLPVDTKQTFHWEPVQASVSDILTFNDESGLIDARSEGVTAVVAVSDADPAVRSAAVTVTVINPARTLVASDLSLIVSLNGRESLDISDDLHSLIYFGPRDYSSINVGYATSDPAVVSISQDDTNGQQKFIAHKTGSSVVTTSLTYFNCYSEEDTTITLDITVFVSLPIQSVIASISPMQVCRDSVAMLTLKAQPEGAVLTSENINLTIADTLIARIGDFNVEDGVSFIEVPVEGLFPGTTTILNAIHPDSVAKTIADVDVVVPLQLSKGWQWVTCYQPTYISGEALETAFGSSLIEVRSQSQNLFNDPDYGYIGSLYENGLWQNECYKINMAEDASHVFERWSNTAEPYSGSTLDINKRWTWIPNPYYFNHPIEGYVSGAEEDDMIVAQHGFAVYYDGQWNGSLEALHYGEAYMYYSEYGYTTLEFKAEGYGNDTGEETKEEEYEEENEENEAVRLRASHISHAFTPCDSHRFMDNMCVIATLGNGFASIKNCQIGAFVGSDCRGKASCKDGYFFLTVHGDAGETVSLRLYDEDHDTYYNIEGTIGLKPLVGSMKEPFLLHQAGHETSVVDIRESIQKDDYYTLEGIQLRQTPRKGVYIHNGRKVVIR